MLKITFLSLLFASKIVYAREINIDSIDRIKCQANFRSAKVELTKGAYMTAPPSFYLTGNHVISDDQNHIKSKINIYISENESGLFSVFFTLFTKEGAERIKLGGSKFKVSQGLDTWIGLPGTGTIENPEELHLICVKN